MQAARDREVRVDPDVHAAAVSLAAVGAADDDERLLVLPEYGIEQLGLVGRARLPVGPDERHRTRVVRSQPERLGKKLEDTVGVHPVLDGEQVTGVIPGGFRQQGCRAPRTPGAEEAMLRRHVHLQNRLDPNVF